MRRATQRRDHVRVTLEGVRRALRAIPTLVRVGLAEAVAYRAEMLVWLLSMLAFRG